MLRRKSEFFVFLDSVRSVKSEKEEREREERQPRPFEEYLQVLLQMKMTSAVSEQKTYSRRVILSIQTLGVITQVRASKRASPGGSYHCTTFCFV